MDTDTKTITPGDRNTDTEEQAAGRQSPDFGRPNFSLRLVLVGKTGAGKSSSGNTILGRTCFPAPMSAASVTKECRKDTGEVGDTPVMVVDTPGLFDTDMEEDALERKIAKCINMTAPGPHAIIIVIKVGPFTKEERLSVERVRAIFGENADQHAIILFTHGDDLSTGIEKYVSDAQDDLKKLIAQCGGRYHVFNNKDPDNRVQVIELLDKIHAMRSASKQDYYTSQMYHDVEHKLQEREMELVTLYTNELKKQEEDLTKRFDAEKIKLEKTIETLQQSNEAKECKIKALQDLVKKKEQCLRETRRYFESRQMDVRSEAEQTQLSKEIATTICYRLQKICFH